MLFNILSSEIVQITLHYILVGTDYGCDKLHGQHECIHFQLHSKSEQQHTKYERMSTCAEKMMRTVAATNIIILG